MHTMRISGNINNSSSASLVVNNGDLLFQILLCLPVKSLLVLKPVSKHWYSLITDSYFMQKHCVLHTKKLSVSGLFLPKYDENSIPSYDRVWVDDDDKANKVSNNVSFVIQVNEQPVDLNIEQSCNGLLLCHGPSSCTGIRYIYNPSTRHYRTIPPPPPFQEEIDWSSFDYQFYLAYSPQKSLTYEIVCMWGNNDHDYQIAIYSSRTCSWRVADYMFNFYLPCCGVYWNDCLNWIIHRDRTLVYFNIAQQVLKMLRYRDETRGYRSEPEYFGECMGHMYLILQEKDSTSICVFEMEIDYSGWRAICRVDLGELTNQYGNGVFVCYLNYRILKVVVEGDGDEYKLKALIILPHKILSYDLQKKSFNKICDYPMVHYVHYSHHAYIGSFANV